MCLQKYKFFFLSRNLSRLTRHYTDDIPDISLYKIRIALKQLKNRKAPSKDRITAELLKTGEKPILTALQKLFDTVLLEAKTPKAWNRGEVVGAVLPKG
jgi:hypothetical protein